jgi:hypothetical protein
MIEKKEIFNLQKGQMIPLIVVLFLVLVGMVALITDGSVIMSNRRTAQAAADSGALAGAKRACAGYADAVSVAEAYATGNGATSVSVSLNGTQVSVSASVENESFFSRVFGEDNLDTSATATAGCYSPRGNSVVPLAWYCRPNIEGGPYPSDYDCQIQTLSWDLLRPLVDGEVSSIPISDYDGNVVDYYLSGTNVVDSSGDPPEQLYIIMDSDKTCLEDGGDYQCDLDEDGKKDLLLGGNRGWLYLSADTSNIANSLSETHNLQPHIWLTGKSGVTTSVYIQMVSLGFEGRVVLVPVYNTICDGDPETTASCLNEAHASPPWPAFSGTDVFDEMRHKQQTNYHIIAFEPFYITCVDKKGNCPGYTYAQSLENNETMKDDPVVEGFFLTDVNLAIDSSSDCSINLGNCQISLSE